LNIGWISQALPYLPSRGGFRLGGGNLIKQLSRRHRIDLVSMLIEEDAAHLEWPAPYCASVHTIPVRKASLPMQLANAASAHLWGRPLHQRQELDAIVRPLMREHAWDVVHVEGAYAGGILRSDLPIAKVLALHNSWAPRSDEMLEGAQNFKEWGYYTFRKYHEPRYERLVYPRYERCTVVADADAQAIRENVSNCTVDLIPYGTDTEYFHPVDVAKEPRTLVFHGHLAHAPDVEAALEFADDIFPRVRQRIPDAVFHLVGARPVEKVLELGSRPGIRISADLPDLRSAVCSGGVYVGAIRHWTGLTSRMLEAMAMRMPIVGYPGSIAGLIGVPGKHYLLAHTPQEFAAHVIDLLEHPARAEQLARAVRELVETDYSWESRARTYEELYQQVIKEREQKSWQGHGH
jgi:glycosyltransferase involved in cell wall biosynthesis